MVVYSSNGQYLHLVGAGDTAHVGSCGERTDIEVVRPEVVDDRAADQERLTFQRSVVRGNPYDVLRAHYIRQSLLFIDHQSLYVRSQKLAQFLAGEVGLISGGQLIQLQSIEGYTPMVGRL